MYVSILFALLEVIYIFQLYFALIIWIFVSQKQSFCVWSLVEYDYKVADKGLTQEVREST